MEDVEFVTGNDVLTGKQLHKRPADLLIARFQSIPFDDRAGYLDGLINWSTPRTSETARDIHVRLIAAAGGFGKTRLAMEVIELLKKQQWVAGFLPRAATDAPNFIPVVKQLLQLGRPAGYFIVLDYAELRPNRVKSLVAALSALSTKKGKPVRILMLARSDEWWADIVSSSAGVKVCDPDSISLENFGVLSGQDRKDFFHASVDAFSQRMKEFNLAISEAAPLAPSDLTTNELYDRPLTIAMAAFLALRGANRSDGKINLFDALLEEEERNWLRSLEKSEDEALDQERLRSIKNGANQVTFLQGAREKTVLELRMRDESCSGHSDIDRRSAARSLSRIYAVSTKKLDGWVGPIEPDILGEVAVLSFWQTEKQSKNIESALNWALEQSSRINEDVVSPCLFMLFRSFNHVEARTRDLSRKLYRHLHFEVMEGRIGYKDQWLGVTKKFLEQLNDSDHSYEQKNKFINYLFDIGVIEVKPDFSTFKSIKSEAGSVARVVRLSESTEGLIELRADLKEALDSFDEDTTSELVGIVEYLLAVDDETRSASAARRILKDWTINLLPTLGQDSLSSLEINIDKQTLVLADFALAIADRRFELSPDGETSEQKSQRAAAFGARGNRLSNLGRREEALAASEEAVKIYRELAASEPDAFLPNLAMSLNNLSADLSALGRREEALAASEEAVKIYRELAASQPDAFLPNVAMSLNNLGNRLSNIGRRVEALAASERSVAIYKELAASRSDVFLPDLANSFNNLGTMFSHQGRMEEALAASEESVAIYKELAASQPDAFLPDLGRSLNNLSAYLSSLGRLDEALEASERSVAIYKELAASRPDAFLPILANSYNNFGAMLSHQGRLDEALAASEKSVAIYKELAASRPDAFLPDLASSLSVFGDCLMAYERFDDAVVTYEESLKTLESFYRSYPDAYGSLWNATKNGLRTAFVALGLSEDKIAARMKRWE